jgi:hypothetical protein
LLLFVFRQAQQLYCLLGRYLAGVFLVEGFAAADKLPVNHRAYRKNTAAVIHLLFQQFKLQGFAVFVSPAIEFVLVVHFHAFQRFQVNVGNDDPFVNKLFGPVVALVKVYGAYQGFQGIAEDLADLEKAVVFIVDRQLAQAHFDGNLIKLLPVHDLGSHFSKITFCFVGVLPEQVIANDGAQDGVTEVFQPFIAFQEFFFAGTVA